MKSCKNCDQQLTRRPNIYCSNVCQQEYQYQKYIQEWRVGFRDGSRGVNAKGISEHVKRYMLEKYGKKCSLCGCNRINPVTHRIPLEIDHIDGNSDNNLEDNLRIICPNCHSLTTNFRNLNKGYGREWRKLKYVKVNR